MHILTTQNTLQKELHMQNLVHFRVFNSTYESVNSFRSRLSLMSVCSQRMIMQRCLERRYSCLDVKLDLNLEKLNVSGDCVGGVNEYEWWSCVVIVLDFFVEQIDGQCK